MKEELISFDTAKLAKEKGFEQEYYPMYLIPKTKYKGIELTMYNKQHYSEDRTFSCCTQSLLQRWLREVSKYILLISINDSGYYWETFDINNNLILDYYNLSDEFDTYEEALEEGLLQSLKLINNG